jgi:hypothetical protein
MIKLTFFFLIFLLFYNLSAQSTDEFSPEISIFDSIDLIQEFLNSEAKFSYNDKYISRISLEYIEENPKKGIAWVYFFAFKQTRIGGSITIYHYMDGEIIEFINGP